MKIRLLHKCILLNNLGSDTILNIDIRWRELPYLYLFRRIFPKCKLHFGLLFGFAHHRQFLLESMHGVSGIDRVSELRTRYRVMLYGPNIYSTTVYYTTHSRNDEIPKFVLRRQPLSRCAGREKPKQ